MSEPIDITKEVVDILGKIPIQNLFRDCYVIEILHNEIIIHRHARDLDNNSFLTPDGESAQDYIPVRYPLVWTLEENNL